MLAGPHTRKSSSSIIDKPSNTNRAKPIALLISTQPAEMIEYHNPFMLKRIENICLRMYPIKNMKKSLECFLIKPLEIDFIRERQMKNNVLMRLRENIIEPGSCNPIEPSNLRDRLKITDQPIAVTFRDRNE